MGEGDYRLSDADREHIVEQLRRHCGDGRITLDEFAERADVVYQARTHPDLAGVLADLPPLTPTGAALPAPASPPVAGPAVRGAAPKKRKWFVGVMNGVRRRGRWRVDRPMTALAFWGSVDLDFRGAQIEVPVVEVTAWAIMGGVTITVPDGIPVEVDGFMLMGGLEDRTRAVGDVPGAPLIRVTGYGMWGSVDVKTKKPGAKDLGELISDRIQEGLERKTGRLAEHQRRHAQHDARRGRGGPAVPTPPALPMPRLDDLLPPILTGRTTREPEPATPAPAAPPATPEPAPSAAATTPPAATAPPAGADPVGGADPAVPSGTGQRTRLPSGSGLIDSVAAGDVATPDHDLPRGTVTILFTDIAGSTEVAERVGDQRWLGVLQTHNALVREQLARHGGNEVKVHGDGFMAVFPSARAGLLCAIGIQRAMTGYRAGHPDTPIEVRIGLHTGEVVEEGGDYFGRNVILAARIAGEADGGEILASALVKELTDSAGDLGFDGGREVELKGLSRPWRVHRVEWA